MGEFIMIQVFYIKHSKSITMHIIPDTDIDFLKLQSVYSYLLRDDNGLSVTGDFISHIWNIFHLEGSLEFLVRIGRVR